MRLEPRPCKVVPRCRRRPEAAGPLSGEPALGVDHLVDRELLDVGWALPVGSPAAAIPSVIRTEKASKSSRDSQKSMIPQPPSIGPDA